MAKRKESTTTSDAQWPSTYSWLVPVEEDGMVVGLHTAWLQGYRPGLKMHLKYRTNEACHERG